MNRILIVEDDRFFREMFSSRLKEDGYEVDCVSTGAGGLESLARTAYDLIIADLALPDIDGMEFLSRIRGHDPTVDVIMVTGNANLESAIFSLKQGARDYLIKPVNADEFSHAVALCMEQRRLLDENEELRNMLSLYQASRVIAGSLELDRIYHMLVDAVARQIGISRALGLFLAGPRLELKEIRGVTEQAAQRFADIVLGSVSKRLSSARLLSRLHFAEGGAATDQGDDGIREAYLVIVRNRQGLLQGIIALLNDPGRRLPAFHAQKKNIQFLLEQSMLAFENAESYSRARDMLFIDELSGLFNYRFLELALDREIRRVERYGSQLAVLFMDIDAFKVVNDTYGHLVGSRVLSEMGALLKQSVREVDVVIRYGGDEFTVILAETGREAAAKVAERIRGLVESHRFLSDEGYNICLTCSIGYSCCPEDTASKQRLLEMADQAMYAGKVEGKNCVRRFVPAP
jgi:diguanylate cyclase (GGDEF)-like protein